MMNKLFKLIGGLTLAVTLVACGGGGGSAGTTVPGSSGTGSTGTDTSTSVTNVAAIVLSRSGSNSSILADGTAKATIVVQALNSGSAAIAGTTLTLSVTGGGVLSSGQVTTGVDGRAAVDVTANSSDQSNRNLVVSASCSACSASTASFTIPVQGASLTLNPSTSLSLQVSGLPKTLTVTARGADNSLLPNVVVSFVPSDTGIVGVARTNAQTNGSGQASVDVSGLAPGNATLSVWALGGVVTLPIEVSATDAGLSFASPAANSIVTLGQPRTILVSAPGASAVTLATTKGTLGGGSSSTQQQSVIGGTASFSIVSSESGVASLTALDDRGRQVSLRLVFSPAVANKLSLTAPQTSVPRASGGIESRVVLTVRALFQVSNGVDQPVANVPISFKLGAGPSGGERIEPALAITNSSGVATVSFIAGTEATNSPIEISAEIPGSVPEVRTGVNPSSNPIEMNIGGGALSVAFGPSTKIQSIANDTLYVVPYSVVVTDSSNNPVIGKAVTLSMRPFAFSTGPACIVTQTYCSEDINGNGSLERDVEDGYRSLLSNDASTLKEGSCPNPNLSGSLILAASKNSLLTPQNSDAGVVPSTVTTDEDGVATFNLTYLKQSGLWVIPILRATVESNGTESSSSTIFRLRVSEEDLTDDGKCYLPDSPYRE